MQSIKWIGLCAAALLLQGTVALADPTVVADWTFETSMPATAGPFTAEIGAGSALGFHAGTTVYSTPAGNGSAHSFSSTAWSVGDYYQFQVSTVGNPNVALNVGSNQQQYRSWKFYSAIQHQWHCIHSIWIPVHGAGE